MSRVGAGRRLLASASRACSGAVRTQYRQKITTCSALASSSWFNPGVSSAPFSSGGKRCLQASGARGAAAEPSVDTQPPVAWTVKTDAYDEPDQAGGTITLVARRHPDLVLNEHWLRDACECRLCVDPHSGQKNFDTTEIPPQLHVGTCSQSEDGDLEVVWLDDFLSKGTPHASRYPASLIQNLYTHPKSRVGIKAMRRLNFGEMRLQKAWGQEEFEKLQITTDYEDWISGGESFFRAMTQLHTYGLLFLRNVPSSEESVVNVASKIGGIQETFYGRTWDVRSKPQAENVAYTSSFLGLHQDLLYVPKTPRIQLLHCLENSCDGGESIFSDGFRASQIVSKSSRGYVLPLSTKSVVYQYDRNGHKYRKPHPIIFRGKDGEPLPMVRWSPPFQSSVQLLETTRGGSGDYNWRWAAAKAFRELLEDKTAVLEYRLRPGDCVLFDNWRVLHGRRSFNTDVGKRWLKGAYIDQVVYLEALKALQPRMTAHPATDPEHEAPDATE